MPILYRINVDDMKTWHWGIVAHLHDFYFACLFTKRRRHHRGQCMIVSAPDHTDLLNAHSCYNRGNDADVAFLYTD